MFFGKLSLKTLGKRRDVQTLLHSQAPFWPWDTAKKREREGEVHIHIDIYIYRERESQIERERERQKSEKNGDRKVKRMVPTQKDEWRNKKSTGNPKEKPSQILV